jgi:O-6-methylguanine DNA methyltransferase
MGTSTKSITYSEFPSPAGDLFVAHDGERALAVRPADQHRFAAWLEDHLGAPARPAEMPRPVLRALEDAVWGRDVHRPSLAGLDACDRQVLLKTFEIPRGEVRSYAWFASQVGRGGATREIGASLAANPLPLLVPCHRVVRSDFELGWYNCGGRRAKRAMLAHEGVDVDLLDELARGRARFVGSDTAGAFCHPTCLAARQIPATHRVLFRSPEGAQAAGYRACEVCRPLEQH